MNFSDILPEIGNAATAVTQNPVAKFLEGGAINAAQDIGAGFGMNQTPQTQQSQQQAMDLAKKAETKASQESDPAEKARLHAVASQAYGVVSQNAQQQAQSFSPDVQQNPLLRGAVGGAQIGTGADVLAHPISTVKGAVDTVKGGLNAITHPIQTLGAVSDFLKNPLPPIISFVKNELANPDTGKLVKPDTGITKLGNRVLAGQFKDASKVTQNPAQTMGNLARYGLSKPEDIADAASKVTGSANAPDGKAVLNKAVTQAANSVGPINMGEVKDAGGKVIRPGLIQTAQNAVDNTDFLSPVQRNRLMQKINNAVNKPTENIEGGTPNNALTTLRAWEDKASNAIDTLHGNFKPNVTAEEKEISQFYQTMAKDLSQRIFGDTGLNDQPLSNYLSNNDMKVLKGIHPQLATDAQNTSVLGGRSLQRDFVNGSKMANANAASSEGPLTPGEALTGTAAALTGNPLAVGATLAQTRPGMNVVGNTLRGIGGLNSGNALTRLDLPAIVRDTKNNSNQTQNTPNQGLPPITASNNTAKIVIPPAPEVNSLPQSASDIKPAPDGSLNLTNPYTSGLAIDKNTYLKQQSSLQDQISTLEQSAKDPANQMFPKSGQIAGQIASAQSQLSALDAQNTTSRAIDTPYQNGTVIVSAVKQAISDLGKSGSNLLESNGTINDTLWKTDGPYSGLVGAVDNLQKLSGVTIYQPGITSDVLKSNILQAEAIAVYNTYYSQLGGGYAGGSQSNTLPQITSSAAPQASQALPPITSGGGGSVQGTPHPFSY